MGVTLSLASAMTKIWRFLIADHQQNNCADFLAAITLTKYNESGNDKMQCQAQAE